MSAAMFFSMSTSIRAEGEPGEGTQEETAAEIVSEEETAETTETEAPDITEEDSEETGDEESTEAELSEGENTAEPDPEEVSEEITFETEPEQTEEPEEVQPETELPPEEGEEVQPETELPQEEGEEVQPETELPAEEGEEETETSAETVTLEAGEEQYTLEYTLKENGTYSVTLTEISGSAVDIVIPDKYSGKAVTEYIPDHDFDSEINSISFPDSIREIPGNLFYVQGKYNGKSFSDYGSYPRSGGGMITPVLDTQDVLSAIPAFISNHYVDGAYYAGKCLVRVDPNYTGDLKVKDGTICILQNALAGCSGIGKVTLPSSVEFIGYSAFANSSLTEINIPASVKTPNGNIGQAIPTRAFLNCNKLKTVNIQGHIDEIGYAAFADCSSLVKFDFTKVGSIQSSAFVNAFDPSANVTADLSKTKFSGDENGGANAVFAFSGLSGVIFGSGSSDFIPYAGFYNNTNLKSVKTSKDGMYIATSAFENDANISTFVMKPGYISTWGFYKAFDPAAKITVDLTKAEFKSVFTIGNYTYTQYGAEQFAESGIKGVIFGNETIEYLPFKLFYKCAELDTVKFGTYQKRICTDAFGFCTSLTDDILADSHIEVLECRAISDTPITEITIPESLKSMYGGALANNTKLNTINWKAADFGGNQFFADLNDFPNYIYGDPDQSYRDVVTHFLLPYEDPATFDEYFNNDVSIIMTAPKVLNIYVMPPNPTYFKMLPTVETVNFKYAVEEIPMEAFQGCLSLKEVNLSDPTALKKVGSRAFAVSGLEEVVIMKGVEYGSQVFFNDALLKKVVVEEGVTELGDMMFEKDDDLEIVSLPETLTKINWAAFKNALNGTLLYIPESVTMIEDDAFARTEYYQPGTEEYSGAGKTDDGDLQLILASDPMIETAHPGVNEGANNYLPIPADMCVYTDKGVNFQAYEYYAGVMQTRPEPGKPDLTIENLPSRVKAGEELDTSAMVVKLNGTELAATDYTLDYDAGDLTTGQRTVHITVNEELTKGLILVEGADKAKNFYPAPKKGTIYDLYGKLEGSFTIRVYSAEESEPEEKEVVALDRDYIILDQGDSLKLNVVEPEGFQTASVTWSVENDVNEPYAEGETPLITVEDDGTVTAGETEGTAYVLATITDQTGAEYYARTRVDVVTKDIREDLKQYGVRLIDTKVKVALLSTDYTPVRVQLTLKQNMNTFNAYGTGNNTEEPKEESKVQSAEFTNRAVSNIFDLKVYDDLTVEIIPKAEYVTTDAAVLKTVKGSYKSAITLMIDDKPYTSDQVLKISVNKKLPKVTVSAVTLNSFFDDGKQLKIKGDTVENVTTADTIPWLELDSDGAETMLWYDLGANRENWKLKKNAKMNLQVQLAGWAVPVNTKVTVKAAPTVPKMAVKPASLTLNPGTDDTAVTSWKITPAVFAEDDVTISRIAEGTSSTQNTDDPYSFEVDGLTAEISDGMLSVSTEEYFDGSKARTFKVYLSVDGVEYPVTVKTLKQATAVKLTLKASGNINLRIPESFVKITASTKNYNKDAAVLGITEIRDASGNDLTNRFTIDIEGNVIKLTENGGVPAGTYTAAVNAYCGSVTVEKTVKIKVIDKALAQSVTLKGKGKIDVLRPGTAVTMTPAFKNCFEYELSNVTVTNKAKIDVSEKFEWEENEDGSINISIVDGAKVLHTDKYTVTATYKVNGTETTLTSKPAKLTVTQGKSSAVIDKKKAEVHKLDSYSLAEVKITLTDDTVAGIDRITYVSPKAGGQEVFTMRELGNDTYAIAFNSNLLPANLKYKGGTVKIQVFMKGNETAKPNTTFNVKVTLK